MGGSDAVPLRAAAAHAPAAFESPAALRAASPSFDALVSAGIVRGRCGTVGRVAREVVNDVTRAWVSELVERDLAGVDGLRYVPTRLLSGLLNRVATVVLTGGAVTRDWLELSPTLWPRIVAIARDAHELEQRARVERLEQVARVRAEAARVTA
jgi:hypothetical protein